VSKPAQLAFVKSRLRTGGTWTATALAAELECNEKTVRRIMNRLRDVEKWPIESGKTGYWLRASSLAETRISGPQEIAALAMAQEALRLLGTSELAVQLRMEIARLCRQSEDFGDLRWEDLKDAISKGTSGESTTDFDRHGRLTLAILQRLPVEIRYRRLEEDHDYACVVFPHRLIHRDHCWYLIAHDLERGGQKNYALPRITAATPLPRPNDFDEPVFEDRHSDAFGSWTPYEGGELVDVCVELSGYWSRIAREKIWHASQRLESLGPDIVRINFRVSELVQVKTWVLGFGGAAKVIGPAELREMVVEELRQMHRNHA